MQDLRWILGSQPISTCVYILILILSNSEDFKFISGLIFHSVTSFVRLHTIWPLELITQHLLLAHMTYNINECDRLYFLTVGNNDYSQRFILTPSWGLVVILHSWWDLLMVLNQMRDKYMQRNDRREKMMLHRGHAEPRWPPWYMRRRFYCSRGTLKCL